MTKCVNVYKGLRYTNSGDVMFCCKSETWLDDKNGNKANLETHTFDEVMNGNLAVEIRNDLENGIRNNNCKKCWEEEDAGIASKRILDNNRAVEYWGEEYLNDKKAIAQIVEFNLGTLCNLKCRICGPWSSSKWVKEHYVVNEKTESFSDYMKQVKEWQGNWEDDSKSWLHIEENLPNLKQIDFYGGEPFLVEKNWSILQKSVDAGYSKNQILHFNTNGTQYNENHISILKEYKSVLISLSIDDLYERFEYQRNPAKWSEVYENIIKFSDLSKNTDSIDVAVCITVNNLNVFYVPEIVQFFDEMQLPYYINLLHGPPHYNIRNIKESVKEKITDKYNDTISLSEYSNNSLKNILNYMNNYISSEGPWSEFIKFTASKDNYRKESFEKTFPELFSIIEENS